jgi:caa(3)-type oxidase subunit IV
VKKYLPAFLALVGLTALNVAVTRVMSRGLLASVVVLTIAAVEAAIAAMVFMHVGRERRWVYGALLLTVVVLAGLLFWPAWDVYDRPRL